MRPPSPSAVAQTVVSLGPPAGASTRHLFTQITQIPLKQWGRSHSPPPTAGGEPKKNKELIYFYLIYLPVFKKQIIIASSFGYLLLNEIYFYHCRDPIIVGLDPRLSSTYCTYDSTSHQDGGLDRLSRVGGRELVEIARRAEARRDQLQRRNQRM